ncbi:MAG: NAD(P)/FAD-dependent oxidoreductase [Lachnospiraceae bacterium]|jgi:predicted Rossmann fold flavoprotein|nr:NAD(P)/FAD-dependent oxidoreductase [Lachnospiraceae bacterium]
MKTVVVIGGGAAGMMAAIKAAEIIKTAANDEPSFTNTIETDAKENTEKQNPASRVILIEKNEKLGKKLYITGKGRCNFTNNATKDEFFQHIVSNPKFLYSAYHRCDNEKVKDFFLSHGVKIKEERGKRVFPVSDRSSDIIKALTKQLAALAVEVRLGTKVKGLKYEKDDSLSCGDLAGVDDKRRDRALGKKKEATTKITGVILENDEYIAANKVIIATGGLSYPSTGATGDGFMFAEACGHRINQAQPALVPLVAAERWCQKLQGLSLRNVAVTLESSGKTLYRGQGEMIFTHFGVSGPLILAASSFCLFGDKKTSVKRDSINGALAKKTVEKKTTVTLSIDLKPGLSLEQLDKRLWRDFSANSNKMLKNIMGGLLPAKLHSVIISLVGIDEDKKINEITKEERRKLAEQLKKLQLTIIGTRGFEEAIITRGGISVSDINPATMESKIVKNLYFAGEVMDVDALTGGFNLQIAWSTGWLAGSSI